MARVTGAVLDAQFDPTHRFLYILASELIMDGSIKGDTDGEPYLEQPLLMVFDRESQDLTKLLLLPQQQRIHMSLAPDGLSLLLDLDSNSLGTAELDPLQENTEQPMWLIPLFEDAQQRLTAMPQVLSTDPFPFRGIQATWLP